MSIHKKIGFMFRLLSVTVENLPNILTTAISAIYESASGPPQVLDARGIPTNACPKCGGNILTVDVIFDEEYTVSYYMYDAKCAQCGTLLTAPTPENLISEDINDY